ncbi:hypothetical protein ACFQVC_22670 [Streptomyces monticola]|uniref:Uncharacterized protein n=1 Tax=Streptomyces monticola TaxID=2666263 RepID=A0ABW2JNJ9_9ACTN
MTARRSTTTARTAAVTACLTAGALLAGSGPAASHIVVPPGDDGPGDWGTVVSTDKGLGANAWLARMKGVSKVEPTPLREAAFPARKGAPEDVVSAKDITELKAGDVPMGQASADFVRARGDRTPPEKYKGDPVDAPGAATADIGSGQVALAIPSPGSSDKKNPDFLTIDLSGLAMSAVTRPGKPIEFTAMAKEASIGYGPKNRQKTIDLGDLGEPNRKLVLPQGAADDKAMATVTVNEIHTTDQDGKVTLNKRGNTTILPESTCGYANAVHASLLGPEVADVTVGHVAACRKPDKKEQKQQKKAAELRALARAADRVPCYEDNAPGCDAKVTPNYKGSRPPFPPPGEIELDIPDLTPEEAEKQGVPLVAKAKAEIRMPTLLDTVASAANSFFGFLGSIGQGIINTADNIIKGGIQVISDAGKFVWDGVNHIAGVIGEAGKNFFGWLGFK